MTRLSPIMIQPNIARVDSCHIDMPELISALSFALDLTENAVPGHALRTCVLGMRIAESLRLQQHQMSSLYYALLLKDIGCSCNATRMDWIVREADTSRTAELRAQLDAEAWVDIRADLEARRDASPQATRTDPLLHRLDVVCGQRKMEALKAKHKSSSIFMPIVLEHQTTRLIGDRGASIISQAGFSKDTAGTVRALDEHWDGSGFPGRLRRECIPLLSRIAAVAQHLDVFASLVGPDQSIAKLRERSGRWFDPEIVRVAVSLDRNRKLWKNALAILPEQGVRQTVLDLEPRQNHRLGPDSIDKVCQAFSDLTDAKLPSVVDHSMGVADSALVIAQTMGLSTEKITLVLRAALLHDLGKLHIPNSILEKRGELTVEEFLVVKEHPALTRSILGRIEAFEELAFVAGAHHERLDGTGYPDRLMAQDLSVEARVIAVADVYTALSEERPYRKGLEHEQVMAIMQKETPGKLDPVCFEALVAGLEQDRIAAARAAAS